jgi:hypothetical protein
MECLQNVFISNGCIDSGKGYPKDIASANKILLDASGNARKLDDIANYIYALAVISATGVDQNGTEQPMEKWSTASVFCTGKKITTPCDTAAKDFGPLSSDCLVYLWDNMGSANSLGGTYNQMSQGTSLFEKGKNPRFCQRAGTLSPRGPDGKDRPDVIAYWKAQGGVKAVKSMMKAVNDGANDSSPYTSDADRGPYITQCYGDIKLAPRPKPLNTKTPLPSCPAMGCGTLARYVRYYNNPARGWLYVSQIVVYDIYGNNVALNKKVRGPGGVGWPGPLANATNGDTSIGNNLVYNWNAGPVWIEVDLGELVDVVSVYLYQNPGWAFGWPNCDAEGGRIELGTASKIDNYNNGAVYGTGDRVMYNGTIYSLKNFIGAAGYVPFGPYLSMWNVVQPEVGELVVATKNITTSSKDEPVRFLNFENPNPDPKCLQCISNCPYPKDADVMGLCGKSPLPVIKRVTDNGYTQYGGFASHFPSPNKIILDSRGTNPDVGSSVTGPFIQPGTKVTALSNYGRLPSNPYVDGTVITLDKPLVNISENKGDIFTYKFKSGW